MGQPAARIGDNVLQTAPHCHAPIHPAALVPTPLPHPPMPLPIVSGSPNVMIGGSPAARATDQTQPCMIPACVPGGPGIIAKGSATVMINKLPAARLNDTTMHAACIGPIPGPSGMIVGPGCPTVLIGDKAGGGGGGGGGGGAGTPAGSASHGETKGHSSANSSPAASASSAAVAGASTGSHPHAPLSPPEAKAWFDKFKSDKTIPWNYPNDCCYTRAQVMAGALNSAGVSVGKVWNYAPSLEKPLTVATNNDPSGHVEWGYHVAPTVPVRGSDGVVRPMVLDPSITNGPVTTQQWKKLQGQPESEIVETSADPYYRAPNGRTVVPPPDSEMAATFAEHRANTAANWAHKK